MLSYQANKEWLHKLMDLLEAHFGPDVEFVLHDLTLDYEHTIVDIRNGHITGREIGGTGDILGLEYIRNASEDNGTYYNFIEYTKEGKTLRSSTLFLRDEDGNPSVSPSTRISPRVWNSSAISTAATGSIPTNRMKTNIAAMSTICSST